MGDCVSVTTTLHSPLVATFVGGALAATALTGASATVAPRPARARSSPACARAGRRLPAERGLHGASHRGGHPGAELRRLHQRPWQRERVQLGHASVGGPNQFLDNEGYCVSRDDDFDSTPPVNYYDAGSAGEGGLARDHVDGQRQDLPGRSFDPRRQVDRDAELLSQARHVPTLHRRHRQESQLGVHHLRVERYFHPDLNRVRLGAELAGRFRGACSPSTWIAATTPDSATKASQLHATSRNVYDGPSGSGAWSGRVAAARAPGDERWSGRSRAGALPPQPGDNYGGVTEFTFPNNTPKVTPAAG